MRCSRCGADNSQGARYCIKCGEELASRNNLMGGQNPSNSMGNGKIPPQNAVPRSANFGNGFYAGNAGASIGQVIPDYNPSLDYRPLGMWTYFGYDILFAIPLVGQIILIIFACGGTKNVNLRNYARSKFCLLIVFFAIFLLLMALGGGLAAYFSI